MASKFGSGSEAKTHNCSKSGDLVGVGGWANGHGSEGKVSKKTDKNKKKKKTTASGDSLDRRSRLKNSKRNKSPMTRWLNEDKKAGPWSHVK